MFLVKAIAYDAARNRLDETSISGGPSHSINQVVDQAMINLEHSLNERKRHTIEIVLERSENTR